MSKIRNMSPDSDDMSWFRRASATRLDRWRRDAKSSSIGELRRTGRLTAFVQCCAPSGESAQKRAGGGIDARDPFEMDVERNRPVFERRTAEVLEVVQIGGLQAPADNDNVSSASNGDRHASHARVQRKHRANRVRVLAAEHDS
jgi:hypothetical protein